MKTSQSEKKKNARWSDRHVVFIVLGLLAAFIVGLLIPSPFKKLQEKEDNPFYGEAEGGKVADTTNLQYPDGSTYMGTVLAGTDIRDGYGRLVTADGEAYEGNWTHDLLPYGTKNTSDYEYTGRFDNKLRFDGYGILDYTAAYVDDQRDRKVADNEIVVKYLGNWREGMRQGLGRSDMADGSMEFGRYEQNELQAADGANFAVGQKVYGIDISNHQKNVSWNDLALFADDQGNVYRKKPASTKYMQPVFFVYIKATEGATYINPTYSVRMIEAVRHGVIKGAYHFLSYTSPVDEQVRNFVETANWAPGDMPPALDVEKLNEIKALGKAKLCDLVYTWLEKVESLWGVKPIIYTSENIRDNYLMSDPRHDNYHFWISRYRDASPDNDDWRIWQFTEDAQIKGNEGPIDVDDYKGDYSDFVAYLKSLGR